MTWKGFARPVVNTRLAKSPREASPPCSTPKAVTPGQRIPAITTKADRLRPICLPDYWGVYPHRLQPARGDAQRSRVRLNCHEDGPHGESLSIATGHGDGTSNRFATA